MWPFSQLPQDGMCYICSSYLCVSCMYPSTDVCLECVEGYGVVNGSCVSVCSQISCE